MVVLRRGGEDLANPNCLLMRGFRGSEFLRSLAGASEWWHHGEGGQEIARRPVGVRHAARLSAGDAAVLDELDQLQNITADGTAEAVPLLAVQADVQRLLGLALVVRAVAEQGVARFLRDPSSEQLPGDGTDVGVGDLAVIGVYVNSGTHKRISSGSKNSRNVLRPSTWRLVAQWSMPQRSPSRMTDSLARVTAV